MISFKDITLADKDTITSFTMKSDRRNCDLSFSNLCSWRFLYDTKFAGVQILGGRATCLYDANWNR